MQRFGFDARWRAWIRACVFSRNISALVNGCPIEEIGIMEGLKQGDPPLPFLFLLVAEGLRGLMRQAVSLNLFTGFSLGAVPFLTIFGP